MSRFVLAVVLCIIVSGCTGVGIGGTLTEVVNERCILLNGSPIELPRGMSGRADAQTIVENRILRRDPVIARLGDELGGSASGQDRSAGACGPHHQTYLRAYSIGIHTPLPQPSSSPTD